MQSCNGVWLLSQSMSKPFQTSLSLNNKVTSLWKRINTKVRDGTAWLTNSGNIDILANFLQGIK